MIEFKESKFYKLLQDFFINNNKDTFIQMLAEFYNRTESIIIKNDMQDELIKELREMFLLFNKEGIDENIVREKVNKFLETSVKIQNIYAKLNTKANIKDIAKISNGTPLFADSISEMIDTTRNYVNTIDGYLYTHVDGSWIKTSVLYQTTGIGNDSINVTNLKNEIIDNLASYDNFKFTIQNGYYNNQTGDFITHNDWRSIKIDVIEGQKFILSATINGALTSLCVYYDNLNNVIGKDYTGIAFEDTVISNAEIIIPKNCTSMAITWKTGTSHDFKKCIINNTNIIKDDINKLNEDIKTDFFPYTNDLIYDNNKAEFTITNGIIKGTLLTSQDYIPCFFNKTSNAIEYTHINQDTIIVVGKKDGKFITYAIGDKDGQQQVTGDMFEFTESNSSFVKIRYSSVSAPTTNTKVKLIYDNNELKVYYNDVLIDSVLLSNLNTSVPFNMFGVVKTSVNDKLNNGLVKNLTILNSVKIKEEVNRIKDVISNLPFSNNYKGKKANFLGDSITEGVATSKIYHQYIQENLDLSVARNYGIGGTCITNIERNNFISRYSNMDNDADLICVFGGTNDFGHHMPLGDINSTDDKTFYGALKVLCEGLINKYVGKTIIFITPLNRSCDKFPADGCIKGQKTNNLGFKLEDYVKAINEVVPSYSIPVYDLFKNSNLYPYNANIVNTFMPDGLHPNADGHYIIGRKISEFIKNQ